MSERTDNSARTTVEGLAIDCEGNRLAGVLHRPAGTDAARIGVVIVVGGPQTRIGSHRQFVLLARALAAAGFAVLRFDLRGMGDSEGEPAGFEHIGPELHAACAALQTACPQLEHLVLWGLCDAASAIMLNAADIAAVGGVVLANPWVFTEAGEAKTLLKHYYLQRLLSRDFRAAVLGGRFNPLRAARSLIGNVVRSFSAGASPTDHDGDVDQLPYTQRMRLGMERYSGRVLIILSGNDLTAAQWRELTENDERWRAVINADAWTRRELPDSTHTFSSAAWRDRVADWTVEWLQQGG
jgi:exosortase A-associated hydrolase 1